MDEERLNKTRLEGVFRFGVFADFKKKAQESGITVDSGQMVERLGEGRAGTVYRMDEVAIKVARTVGLTRDIRREVGIYRKAKGLPGVVEAKFVSDEGEYVALDFVEGVFPDLFFSTKDSNSPEVRRQRIDVLKSILASLVAAMERGLFVNDVDLTSNSLVSENNAQEVKATLIDLGDAIDVDEVIAVYTVALTNLKRNAEQQTVLLNKRNESFGKQKQALLDCLAKLSPAQAVDQKIREDVGKIKNQDIREEAIQLLDSKKVVEAPKVEKKKGFDWNALWGIEPNVPQPIQPQVSWLDVFRAVNDFNSSSGRELTEQQLLVQQLSETVAKLEQLVFDLKDKPQAMLTLVNAFSTDNPRGGFFNELGKVQQDLSVGTLGRVEEFTKTIAEVALELLVSDLKMVTSSTTQALLDEASSRENSQILGNLGSLLVETASKKVAKDRLIKDPYELATTILAQLDGPFAEKYIAAGVSKKTEVPLPMPMSLPLVTNAEAKASEPIQPQESKVTPDYEALSAYGEPKAQRRARYEAANDFYYSIDSKFSSISNAEMKRHVEKTLKMLAGVKQLPATENGIAFALTRLGMHFVSTEEVVWSLAGDLISYNEVSAAKLQRRMDDLFSSINLSGAHRYFSDETLEGRVEEEEYHKRFMASVKKEGQERRERALLLKESPEQRRQRFDLAWDFFTKSMADFGSFTPQQAQDHLKATLSILIGKSPLPLEKQQLVRELSDFKLTSDDRTKVFADEIVNNIFLSRIFPKKDAVSILTPMALLFGAMRISQGSHDYFNHTIGAQVTTP